MEKFGNNGYHIPLFLKFLCTVGEKMLVYCQNHDTVKPDKSILFNCSNDFSSLSMQSIGILSSVFWLSRAELTVSKLCTSTSMFLKITNTRCNCGKYDDIHCICVNWRKFKSLELILHCLIEFPYLNAKINGGYEIAAILNQENGTIQCKSVKWKR